jgi:hypothetical protein
MQRDNTESRAYPCKCLTFGCLATTGVSNLRLPNNDGIRPNTSQYYVRTSQEAQTSTACYGENFTFLYIDDVRISQETHLWTSTLCYEESLTFYM